jgi:hypothetical protein
MVNGICTKYCSYRGIKINAISIAHMECKNQSDTNNDRGNWNHLTIIQKIPEQQTWKAQHQGTTENQNFWALLTYFIKS